MAPDGRPSATAWQPASSRRVRPKPAVESPNGARLCLKVRGRLRYFVNGPAGLGPLSYSVIAESGQLCSIRAAMYLPTQDQFLKLAAQGNLIPVTRRLLADLETPLSAYRKIRGQGESFLLEAVEGGEHLGRYSFVGCKPRAVIRQLGRRVEVTENGKVVEFFTVLAPSPHSASPLAGQRLAPRPGEGASGDSGPLVK